MLNPWLLIFLPLVLVPILLHLITLHRLRTVELSTFRFLMDSYIQQRRRIKLLEWLLMLLRALFVALIVLTMSRPVLQHMGWLTGDGGRDIAIVIDTGATMNLRSDGVSTLERAKATAKALLGELAADDRVTLIQAGMQPKLLEVRDADQSRTLLAALDELKTEPAQANLAGALELAFPRDLASPRVTYVLSDGSSRTWSGLKNQPFLEAAAKHGRLVMLNVGPTQAVNNLAVLGEPPTALRSIVGLPVSLAVTVANSSPQGADSNTSAAASSSTASAAGASDTLLTVFLDDQQVTQLALSIPAGQRTTRPITVIPSKPGLLRGRFELPRDAFPDDDTFLFALNVEPNVKVLVVTQPQAAPGPSNRPEVFLRTALESPRTLKSAATVDEQRLSAALVVTQATLDQVSEQMLQGFDVVMLADVAIDAGRGEVLRKYVESGGGLFIMTGPRFNPEFYQAHLLRTAPALAGTKGNSLLTLQPAQGEVDNPASFASVGNLELTHPVLAAFAAADKSDTSRPPFFSTVRFYRYFPMQLPRAQDREASAVASKVAALPAPMEQRPLVLLRLADGTPLLTQVRLGQGRMLVAGFSATPEWSNLPHKPEFVPMLLRAAAYLRRPAQVETLNNVRPGEPAVVRITERWPKAEVQVMDPQDKPHTIELSRAQTQLVGATPQTNQKGYYRIKVLPRSTAPEVPPELELGFAVNLDTSSHDFVMLDDAAIESVLAPLDSTVLRATPDDPLLVSELTRKHEIWRTLIWVMFAVIGIEFFLSTLRMGQARDATGPPASTWERWNRRLESWTGADRMRENTSEKEVLFTQKN